MRIWWTIPHLVKISKYLYRMENTELEWNIIIERTLSSDVLSYTHSWFLNQKLKHNTNTKEKGHTQAHQLWMDTHNTKKAKNLGSHE